MYITIIHYNFLSKKCYEDDANKGRKIKSLTSYNQYEGVFFITYMVSSFSRNFFFEKYTLLEDVLFVFHKNRDLLLTTSYN